MSNTIDQEIDDLIGTEDPTPLPKFKKAIKKAEFQRDNPEEEWEDDDDDYNPNQVDYVASPTARKFHSSDAFVRGMAGPIGSGKSVACCLEILAKATAQERGPDGIRRTRWAIIRNSYRELQDTTLKTWNDWIPETMREWSEGKMTSTISFNDVVFEVLFRALDRPEDDKKLLSLELTGAWINEAKEVPKRILDMVQGRVGRYPRTIRRKGVVRFKPSWFGVIMDTNLMDVDHWWYRIFEEEKPDSWEVFKQPSGMSAKAENVDNLPPNYYNNLMVGHDSQWIDVYVHGKYGFIMDGKPVHPNFHTSVHVSEKTIEPLLNFPIYAGIDFGRTPAITYAQCVNGQWRFLSEVVTENMGASQFPKEVNRHSNLHYRHHEFAEISGDPAGEQKSQTSEDTPFDILYANGIHATPCHTNDVTIRREVLGNLLLQNTMAGEPAILISPECKTLIKGLAGGFKYRRVQVSGDERFKDEPDKGKYSHVCEAAEYLLLGAGMDMDVVTPSNKGHNARIPKVKKAMSRRNK